MTTEPKTFDELNVRDGDFLLSDSWEDGAERDPVYLLVVDAQKRQIQCLSHRSALTYTVPGKYDRGVSALYTIVARSASAIERDVTPVKPLDWKGPFPANGFTRGSWHAKEFCVVREGEERWSVYWKRMHKKGAVYDSEEAAKRAAQADYEVQVLSQLHDGFLERVQSQGEMRSTLKSLLQEVRDEGLIYWGPNTSRGHERKSSMIARIDTALSEPESSDAVRDRIEKTRNIPEYLFSAEPPTRDSNKAQHQEMLGWAVVRKRSLSRAWDYTNRASAEERQIEWDIFRAMRSAYGLDPDTGAFENVEAASRRNAVRERMARCVYEALRLAAYSGPPATGTIPGWQEGGNSDMETEAYRVVDALSDLREKY